MNFYLLDLIGKWASLISVSLFNVNANTNTLDIERTNSNMNKDISVVAEVTEYTTIKKNDPTLEVGKTKVETSGVDGLVYKTSSVEIVIQDMVPQVTLVGTKKVANTKKVTSQIVYDGLTMEQLATKLNKNLKSTLSGKGNLYAKYALEYKVDPYLAVAISLHETGCNNNLNGCSNLVRTKNNVGGMMGSNGALKFSTLEEGIRKFIKNIKDNYVDYDLLTPEEMNPKYAASTTWATKVNKYIEQIKAS